MIITIIILFFSLPFAFFSFLFPFVLQLSVFLFRVLLLFVASSAHFLVSVYLSCPFPCRPLIVHSHSYIFLKRKRKNNKAWYSLETQAKAQAAFVSENKRLRASKSTTASAILFKCSAAGNLERVHALIGFLVLVLRLRLCFHQTRWIKCVLALASLVKKIIIERFLRQNGPIVLRTNLSFWQREC